ncbi:MAG: Trm112 family protein [Alphaproteobacteria bacterium]|nr:Trm112 family protein [Alphaproteobacteria bacterium]
MKKKNSINPKLFEILVCPLTKGPLRYDSHKKELVSLHAKLAYPIRDGVPILLVDEARELEQDKQTLPRRP